MVKTIGRGGATHAEPLCRDGSMRIHVNKSRIFGSSGFHPRLPSSSPTSFRRYFSQVRTCSTTSEALLTWTAGILSCGCGALESPERVLIVVDESMKRLEKRVDDLERRWVASSQKKWRNVVLLVGRANGPDASVERMTRRLFLQASHSRLCDVCMSRTGRHNVPIYALTRVLAFLSNTFLYERGHALRVR